MLTRRKGFITSMLVLAAIVPGGLTTAQAATATIESTGPLVRIGTSDQLNCSVDHVNGGRQFYGSTACGTLMVAGDVLYGPSSIPAGGGAAPRTPWTPVSQSAVTGAGTDADPHTVRTVVDAGDTGLRVTQTDSYVVGREAYRTIVRIDNSGPAAAEVILYRAGDCYLGGSDSGYGFVVGSNGAVACSKNANNTPADRVEQWVPITGGSSYFQDNYHAVWQAVGARAPFPNTCQCEVYMDNGAGLSWSLTVPMNGAVTIAHLTNFGSNAKLSELEAHPAVLDLDSGDPTGAGLLSYSATLTDPETSATLEGSSIEFYVGSSLVCSAVTGPDGRASCEAVSTLLDLVQAGTYSAVFSGDGSYLASGDSAGLVAIDGNDIL